MTIGHQTIAREVWTLGTRDFRNILAFDFSSRAAAERYMARYRLDEWVVLNVTETEHGRRSYSSPDLPEGPLSVPVAGTF